MARDSIRALLGDAPIVYLDCGARDGSAPAWLHPLKFFEYIGVEADETECVRLNARNRPRHRYVHAVLGRRSEQRTLHITKSPACTSLLCPDERVLAPFGELRDLFTVEREMPATTTPLDEVAADHGIAHVDFLELDLQGAELDTLAGAEDMLRGSVLGLQVEVEFAPIYRDQPLFGDIDAFLRARTFQLFDLTRYRVRRGETPTPIATRGQLLWGQATYLRLPDGCHSPRLSRRLVAIAILLGLPDLALEILSALERSHSPDNIAAGVRRIREELAASGGLRVWKD